MRPDAQTLGELKNGGNSPRTLREETRTNLAHALRSGKSLFPGLHGYEHTVIPQVENAILAGHDILLLGERGQAKSRLARSLTALLDEWIPMIAGSETHDDPFAPVSAYGKQTVAEMGDDTPIAWIHRDQRFAEKLATPDTSIADLIGEVDPIKVAEGRYLSNEEILAFGLIPRANRGIFNLNELPDLSERIQVGLLNILEERDVQIRGFSVRLPLDVLVVASANPEDYTNRGRIITPLKDRFGSQIRTHYPQSVEQELRIVDQEKTNAELEGIQTHVPEFMRELIASISHVARSHPEVSDRSGVSVRMTIADYEAMVANSQRRAIIAGQAMAVPSITDLKAIIPTMMGKIEFETWELGAEDGVVDDIIGEAVQQGFRPIADLDWVSEIRARVEEGQRFAFAAHRSSEEVLAALGLDAEIISGSSTFVQSSEPAAIVSAIHFALEGLYRIGRITRSVSGDYQAR